MIRFFAKKIPALGEQSPKIDMSRKSPASLLLIGREASKNNAAFQEQIPNKHFKTIRERGYRISKGHCPAIQRKGTYINDMDKIILKSAYGLDSTLREPVEMYLNIDQDDRNFDEQIRILNEIQNKVGLALIINSHISLIILQKAVTNELAYVRQQLADQRPQIREIAYEEADDFAEFADELSPHSNAINIPYSNYNARSSAHQPARLLEEEKHHMTNRQSNSIILPYSGYPGGILIRPLARLQPAELADRLPEEEKGHAVPQETEMRPEYLDTIACGAYLESISCLPGIRDYINANHHLDKYIDLYLNEKKWEFKGILLEIIIKKAEQDTNNPSAVRLAEVAKQERAEYFS